MPPFISVSPTVLAFVAAALTLSTTLAQGQGLQPRSPDGLEVEPFVGIVRDPYDASIDGKRSGPMAGLRIGAPLRGPVNVVASAAYARGEDVAMSFVAGSLGVRQRVARRVQLSAGVRAHVFDVLEGGNRVSPALLLGVVVR